MNWEIWAEKALVNARAEGREDLIEILEYHKDTGYEPYYTLKYAVHKLNGDFDEPERVC